VRERLTESEIRGRIRAALLQDTSYGRVVLPDEVFTLQRRRGTGENPNWGIDHLSGAPAEYGRDALIAIARAVARVQGRFDVAWSEPTGLP
jgi:hypothetical protein